MEKDNLLPGGIKKIDYRDLDNQENPDEKILPQEQAVKPYKRFSLAAFKDFWGTADTKVRREVVVLVVMVVLTCFALGFYVYKKLSRINFGQQNYPSAEEMPGAEIPAE